MLHYRKKDDKTKQKTKCAMSCRNQKHPYRTASAPIFLAAERLHFSAHFHRQSSRSSLLNIRDNERNLRRATIKV